MTKRSDLWRQMIEDGRLEEVLGLAARSDATALDLTLAGWTMDGRPVRPECSCPWYSNAPTAHDRLLDFDKLSTSLAVFTVLTMARLGDGEVLTSDDGVLFTRGGEIRQFLHAHGSWVLIGSDLVNLEVLAMGQERVPA